MALVTEKDIAIGIYEYLQLKFTIGTNREFKLQDTDSEGYSKFQLWDLFERFGSHVGLCKQNCFELEILIEN